MYSAYYWGIPAILDVGHRTNEIQNLVKNNSGVDIKLENPELKMGLTPSVWLSASYVEVSDKSNKPFFVVNPKIKIRLIPLIFGKFHLAYFSCDKIKADLKIDKKYRFYIGDCLILKSTNPSISIEDSQMDIETYEISLRDEIQNKFIVAKGDYLNLEKFNSKKYIKFTTNSQVKIDNIISVVNLDVDFKLPIREGFDTNEIFFDGTVTNFNLAYLSPYIKKLSKNRIKQTSGVINIQAQTNVLNRRTRRIQTQMAITGLSIIGKDKSSSIYFKDKLGIDSICDFSKNSFLIKRFKVLSGSIDFDISGKINKLSSKNPLLNLSVLVNKSKSEDFISLLPAINIKNIDINIPALKKYGFYSDMQGEVLIKGHFDKPKIGGNIIFKNGYIVRPLNIPKATVKLNFLGEKIHIDVNVPINQNEKVMVNGNIELYGNKNVILNISSTKNIDLETTESILNPVHEIFYFDIGPLPVMRLKGVGNINLKTDGNKLSPRLFGAFVFRNAEGSFNNLNALLKNGEGSLIFDNQDTHFYTKKATLDGKPIKIDGKCTLFGKMDFDISSNGQSLNKMIELLNSSPMLVALKKSIPKIKNATGLVNIIVKLDGQANGADDFAIGKTVIPSGSIKLLGNNVLISSLDIPIKNLFGNIKFKGSDADFELYSSVEKSKLHIDGKIRNNILHSKIKLDDLAFMYSNIPVKIYSGALEINKDKLTVFKVNALLDSMPILLDGYVTDIFNNPKFNIYMNSKPRQKFIDKYVNKNSLYPLKIKGDIIYSSRIEGTRDSFSTKTELNLQADSSVYYMGSTIGDVNNPIRIFIDANVLKNQSKYNILVNNFQYDKLISSQNDKEFVSQQLNAKGKIYFNKSNIVWDNFRVKTQNPTDVKIFNILFKKPMIKQGMFSSNVLINGPTTSPHLLGSLNFSGVNIPLLDTTIKDISLDFNEKFIDLKAKGEVFSNQIVLISNMQNSLMPPYEFNDVDIYLGNLDVNELVKSLNKLDIEPNTSKQQEQKSGFDITNLIIKKAKIKADSIFVRNIFANNFNAEFSLDEKMLLNMDNFKFDAAQGHFKGDFKYNLLNSRTDLDLDVDNANANSITESLFDLSNQIFGSLTGQVELSCNGKSHKTCMDTLSGKGGFRVADGKMPKLGSLEYLLRAANLVKSGITGITINSIIDLVSPLRTGQFETINGRFVIKSGIADDIQIFSKGKGLSLFLTGKYNFSTLIADMEVFGRVSKKISNILGPVGNTSLNTLFNTIPGFNLDETNKTEFVKNLNKIPGFELNDKTYRIFSAEIYGDINGDNYVQTFKWVE